MKKVISKNNLPARSPILSTLVHFIALDYWTAPEWLWGVFGLGFLLIWINWLMSLGKEIEVDIINPQKQMLQKKSKFRERLDKVIAANKEN